MKKTYETPKVNQIEFSVEEALMASVIEPTDRDGNGVIEIGTKVDLF